MSTFTLFSDNYANSTVISNKFIDEYMAEANDAQLKIYLYLLRSLSLHTTFSVSDIADKFNHTEADVMRSLRYWDEKGLVHLALDENKNITGIHLLSETSSLHKVMPESINAAPKPVPVAPTPKKEAKAVNASPVTAPTTDHNQEALFQKPTYSLDQIKIFKDDESCSQILFIAEQYLGKTLSANDIRSILFFSDVLNFSDDLIDYLLQYCVERGKRDFRYIEKVAINWAESHIKTPSEAESFATKYDKSVYLIMNSLGKSSSSPTAKEVEFIKRWNNEYAFTSDIILEACERTVLAVDSHRFEYADKILSNWKNAGVHHKPDILALDASFQRNKTTSSNTPKTTNKFNQFQQNNYDFDALEARLLNQ